MNVIDVTRVIHSYVKRNGGITLLYNKENNSVDIADYPDGFQVGCGVLYFTKDLNDPLTQKELEQLCKEISRANTENRFTEYAIGAWVDEEAGKILYEKAVHYSKDIPHLTYFWAKQDGQREVYCWDLKCSLDLESFKKRYCDPSFKD